MENVGLTKARSIGPIAEEVERAGGTVARVFRHAEQTNRTSRCRSCASYPAIKWSRSALSRMVRVMGPT